MMIVTASIEDTVLLRHPEAVEQAAYDQVVDRQINEDPKQARASNVKKLSIADVEASTEAIFARYQPNLGSQPEFQTQHTHEFLDRTDDACVPADQRYR